MTSYPVNKWIRGLNTFLACAAIVMLGGTRTLDNRSYNNAHLFLRTMALQFATENGYEGESAWDACYTYTYADDMFAASETERFEYAHVPIWRSTAGSDMQCGMTWLIQDSMPLQSIAASYHQPDMPESEARFILSPGRTSWVTDVPTPPPKPFLLFA